MALFMLSGLQSSIDCRLLDDGFKTAVEMSGVESSQQFEVW